jgi:hypothetical protein
MSEQHPQYDFEIKEQDRFLPIANGKYHVQPVRIVLIQLHES